MVKKFEEKSLFNKKRKRKEKERKKDQVGTNCYGSKLITTIIILLCQ